MSEVRLSWKLIALAALLAGCNATNKDYAKSDSLETQWPIDVVSGLRVPSHGPVPKLADWTDNPYSEAKRKLGKSMFWDPRLSSSGNGNCSACHSSFDAFQSGGVIDIPDRSFPALEPTLTRNAPSLLNIAYAPVFRWDGSHGRDLYEQMALPFAESNMNLTPGIPAEDVHHVDVPLAQVELKRRLTDVIPGYVTWFTDAFDVDIRDSKPEELWILAGKALSIYIRGAVSKDSAFDRWNAGNDDAMSEAAVRGLKVFLGKGACGSCHSGPLFSDFDFHNLSLALPDAQGNRPDEGRYIVTGREEDRGAFLTPTLRSVTQTSPYWHDGSTGSIRSVIRHISSDASRKDPNYSVLLDRVESLNEEEIEDLVQFLKALKGAELPMSVTGVILATEMP